MGAVQPPFFIRAASKKPLKLTLLKTNPKTQTLEGRILYVDNGPAALNVCYKLSPPNGFEPLPPK